MGSLTDVYSTPQAVVLVDPETGNPYVSSGGGGGGGSGLTDAQLRATPVPVSGTVASSDAGVSATGTITTQNLVPAGTATASSAVEITLAGRTGLAIQVTGVYTGALTLQATLDGSVWVTVGGTPLLNINTGALSATITSATQGIFQAEVGGFTKARVTGLAAMTGTATVTIQATSSASVVAIDAALPTGTNGIGSVTLSSSQTIVPIPISSVSSAGFSSTHMAISAATTNATSVKASASMVGSINLTNTSVTMKWFKIYNKASAPTVGTDTPVATVGIPPTTTISINIPALGLRLGTGFAYAITGAAATADTTALAAGDVVVSASYV